MYAESAKATRELAEGLCENENVEKFASGITPGVVGVAVGILTANPVLGGLAAAATAGAAKVAPKQVAVVTTSMALSVAIGAASIVATPVLLCAFVWSIFTD